MVVLLSRVDVGLDPDLRNAPERVYASRKVLAAITEVSKIMDLSPSVIFPVKNYHAERERNFFLEAMVLDAFAASVDQAVPYFQGILKKGSVVPRNTPVAEQAKWIPTSVNVDLPTPPVDKQDQKAVDDQRLKEMKAADEDKECEWIGPTAEENAIGVEVDDFAWSKYQKESDSLTLFLTSLGLKAGDATRKSRIAVSMASGNMRNALKYAFSDEYFT